MHRLTPLKRRTQLQFDSATKFLKSASGTAIVLGRLPTRVRTPGKNAPPVVIRIVIVSRAVSVPYGKSSGKQGKHLELEVGSEIFYSAFQLDKAVVPGCLIVLERPYVSIFNEVEKVTGTATLLKEAIPSTLLEDLPVKCTRLPASLTEMEECQTLVLAVTGEELDVVQSEWEALTFIEGYSKQAEQVYCRKTRNDVQYASALVESTGGYPVLIELENEEKVFASVRLYDNHFEDFGIVNVDAWVKLAPLLFDAFKGFMITYVETKATIGLVANMRNSSAYKYVLQLKCNALVFDMKELLPRVGFEVPASYVKSFFGNKNDLDSEFAQENKMWKNRKEGKVMNLSEYSGSLTRFFGEEEWKFYAVVDYQNGEEEPEKVVSRLHASPLEQMLAELATHTDFNIQYIYAISI